MTTETTTSITVTNEQAQQTLWALTERIDSLRGQVDALANAHIIAEDASIHDFVMAPVSGDTRVLTASAVAAERAQLQSAIDALVSVQMALSAIVAAR